MSNFGLDYQVITEFKYTLKTDFDHKHSLLMIIA